MADNLSCTTRRKTSTAGRGAMIRMIFPTTQTVIQVAENTEKQVKNGI